MSTAREIVPGVYRVLHLNDEPRFAEVVGRNGLAVLLADGRACKVLQGVAPDGRDEEVIRLNEVGCVADVVRACHLVRCTEKTYG